MRRLALASALIAFAAPARAELPQTCAAIIGAMAQAYDAGVVRAGHEPEMGWAGIQFKTMASADFAKAQFLLALAQAKGCQLPKASKDTTAQVR